MSAIVLGHVVGLDEISKHILRRALPSTIKIVDLDVIQQSVYNSPEITEKKQTWSRISQEINAARQQAKMIKGLKFKAKNIEADANKLMVERNAIKQDIHTLWKQLMESQLDTITSDASVTRPILYIGFNIYPKDYRIKIPLGITPQRLSTPSCLPNCLIFETEPSTYSSNQIKFYLDHYRDRIIRGAFPLNLLKKEYLMAKYNKFTDFYHKLGYVYTELDLIPRIITELQLRQAQLSSIKHNVFVATFYQCGNVIPVNNRTPIHAFLTREEAINHIKPQARGIAPIYLYEVDPQQFQMINGQLVSTKPLQPCCEGESLLISDAI